MPLWGAREGGREGAKEKTTETVTDRNTDGEVGGRQTELWTELYRPLEEGDLAVHVKKVADFKAWLQHTLELLRRGAGPRNGLQRVMVLSGPAGCGKSTMVQVVAR